MSALSLWAPASILLLLASPEPRLMQLAPDAAAGCLLLLRMLSGRLIVLALVPVVLAGQLAGLRLADRVAPAGAASQRLVIVSLCGVPRTQGRMSRLIARPHDPILPRRLALGWFDAPPDLQAGSVWQLLLRVRADRGLHGAGVDRERRGFAQGIGARASVRRSALNRPLSAATSRCPLDGVRASRALAIDRALGDRRATAYVQALSLAVRSGFTDADWRLLRATGTTHLVAISGLHIGLVAGFAAGLGRLLGTGAAWLPRAPPPRAWSATLAVPAALAYSALAGFSTPTLRALLMLCLAVALLALRRGVRGWRLLGAALLGVVMLQPLALLEIGFWLSFLAVAALLLPSCATGAYAGRGRRVSAWAAQWRVCLCLAPLGLWLFDGVSLAAPAVNLAVIPVFAFVVVPLVLTGSLLAPAAAGVWLLGLAADVLDAVVVVLEWVADWPELFWQPGAQPGPLALLACGVAVATLAWPRPGPRGAMVALLLVPLLISPPAAPAVLRVHVVDVGQGLAVLVRTRSRALLYDTGPSWSGGGSAARSRILPLLRELGLERLERIVVSHSDIDHAGGAAALAEAFPRASVYAPQPLPLAGSRDCTAGQSWAWDGVRFTVLHPGLRQRRLRASDNDLSCVLLVETPAARLLLTGDISRRAEAAMLRRYPAGAVDVLLAPHHGSRSSSGAALAAASRPRYVVFAAGHRNRWGFPDAGVSRRWSEAGACLLSSGEHGTLYFAALPAEPLRLIAASRRDARRAWTWGRVPVTCEDGAASVK